MNALANFLSDNEAALWTIAVGALTNASCAMLGCYLVLRRLSLLGDAISHAILPGIAVAFLFTGSREVWPMFLGALALGVLTAMLTETLSRFGRVPHDSSMGVVFSALFALGVILITRLARNVDLDPGCVLYGLIDSVSQDTRPVWGVEVPRVIAPLGLALVATIVFVTVLWKELKLASFDPGLATAMGFSATLVHYLLMAMVSAVTVASFESVGSILVIAMLIVPPAAAHLLSDRLGWMMAWAVAIGVVSAAAGYYLAVWANTSVAGMMAVAAGAQFALAVFCAPRHGIISKAAHQLALGLRIVREDVVGMLYRVEESRSARRLGWRDSVRAVGGGLAAYLALPMLVARRDVALAWDGTLSLTPRGRASAGSLVRSHRLWEAYLNEHFQLPLDHLHEAAERVEHYIGPAMQDRLAAELSRPGVDPHGREIPATDGGAKKAAGTAHRGDGRG